jgi:hypothetical protein
MYTRLLGTQKKAMSGTHFLHNHPDLANSLTKNNMLKYKFPMDDAKFLNVW